MNKVIRTPLQPVLGIVPDNTERTSILSEYLPSSFTLWQNIDCLPHKSVMSLNLELISQADLTYSDMNALPI